MQVHIWSHPKRHKPSKWWLNLDLSSPDDHTVNDGISKDIYVYSLNYVSIDVAGILEVVCGALMAKVDIKQAYQITLFSDRIDFC